MLIEKTTLPDVLTITPRRFSDARGWFSESWSRQVLASGGIELEFVQDNHSFSVSAGTLRGLHFQAPPYAQAKLVRCTRGAVFDVAVDARRGSPTYGQSVGVDLTETNGKQLLVPPGFLHGFITRAPNTEVQYKVTDVYAPDCDGAVRWDSLGIDWGLNAQPLLSVKDAAAPSFETWESPFTWEKTQ